MKTTAAEIEQDKLLLEVVESLSKSQKRLPSKLFYDQKGSLLFDEICRLDEYYLTRTEIKIMQDNIDEITSLLEKKKILVELGSGSSIKTRMLIENLPNLATYIPVDISEDHLIKSSKELEKNYPWLKVHPLAADYTEWFTLPQTNDPILIYYPGSTIGNFTPSEAKTFLRQINTVCGKENELLIGVDLKKENSVLHNAYNDSKGITSEFNLNILLHINNLFNANFDVRNFRHCAFFNEEFSRIEMHLVSTKPQIVFIENNKFSFKEGEPILTEYSYKYSLDDFAELIKDIYSVQKVWLDENKFFSVQLLKAI